MPPVWNSRGRWRLCRRSGFWAPPRCDVANLSLSDPIDARLRQKIPATRVCASAARIRAFAVELMHEELAKSKMRRLMNPQDANEGLEARPGNCGLFFRQAAKRSASSWRGPAEVSDVGRDAAAVSTGRVHMTGASAKFHASGPSRMLLRGTNHVMCPPTLFRCRLSAGEAPRRPAICLLGRRRPRGGCGTQWGTAPEARYSQPAAFG